MKLPVLTLSLLLASLAIIPVSANAQDSQPQDQSLMQDFNDSQVCAAVLLKLGGEGNQEKSTRALAHAKEIAPSAGYGSEDEFKRSYSDMADIVELADEKEMDHFKKFCAEKW